MRQITVARGIGKYSRLNCPGTALVLHNHRPNAPVFHHGIRQIGVGVYLHARLGEHFLCHQLVNLGRKGDIPLGILKCCATRLLQPLGKCKRNAADDLTSPEIEPADG